MYADDIFLPRPVLFLFTQEEFARLGGRSEGGEYIYIPEMDRTNYLP